MIIDAHVHLDDRGVTGVAAAADELARQMRVAEIDNVVALHLESQPWSVDEFAKAVAPHRGIHPFVNIHPEAAGATDKLVSAVRDLGFVGLKLHPRLQEFSVSSPKTIELVRHAGMLGIPVLIDAFPDGTHLMQGFNVLAYADVAISCPRTRIVWAHMGGHRVIDMMMLAKRIPNVFMDTSYSLLYYRGSSVPNDMVYAMRSMRFERIMYGSDYPDRNLSESVRLSIDLLSGLGVQSNHLNLILFKNAQSLFQDFIS